MLRKYMVVLIAYSVVSSSRVGRTYLHSEDSEWNNSITCQCYSWAVHSVSHVIMLIDAISIVSMQPVLKPGQHRSDSR